MKFGSESTLYSSGPLDSKNIPQTLGNLRIHFFSDNSGMTSIGLFFNPTTLETTVVKLALKFDL